MTVIRFNPDEVFNTDSTEYEILVDAVPVIKGVEGAVVEIGTRRGGSARMVMDCLEHSGDTNRSMFCIDPYGNIDLEITNINASIHYPGKHQVEGDPMSKDVSFSTKFDYTNTMRNRVIPSLYYYGFSKGLNFTFFCLEDTEFFARYPDGVPVYDEEKKLEDKFAFVFYDGPHTNQAVIDELNYFLPKSPVGSVYVFDDIWMYDHDMIERDYLFINGFETLRKGNVKASYVRKIK